MFDSFFKNSGQPEKSLLTSLDLKTPAPAPKAPLAASATQKQIQRCGQLHFRDEAHKAAVAAELQKLYREWNESGLRPIHVYFGVLPQQGQPATLSSVDGKFTTLWLFDTPFAAKYAFEHSRPTLAIAGCAVSALPLKAEKWIAAGINTFATNPCRICGPRTAFRAENLLSHDKFATCYGAELVQSSYRKKLLALQVHAQLANDQKAARFALEYLRDHFDAGNPYVHWMIAVFAGMAGDMKANADSITRLETFGPPFVGKLQGTSFDMSPGSQFSTFPEAMMGLLLSYQCLDLEKIKKNPPAQPSSE